MRLSRVLMVNMSGEDVRLVQSKLKEFGFLKEKVDGHFGQNTLMAVTNFQRLVGIKPDGVIGMMSWNKIINYDPNPSAGDILLSTNNSIESNDIPLKPSFIGKEGFMIYDYIIHDNEYIKSETKKDTIWLHNSHGGSRPDWTIGGWEKEFKKDKKGNFILDNESNKMPLKTAINYVIGRKSSSTGSSLWDGKILKSFDDKYWAYHLNLNDPKNDELNSKSISIELCNYGSLNIGKDGRFYNYVNKPVMESEVVEINFRGYKYWEKYTDTQLESLRRLILYSKNRWGMEIQKEIYNETWFDYNKVWFETGGIRSYTQVRQDVYDIFPQKEMIQMLNSL